MSETCAVPLLLAIILAWANAYSRALTTLHLSGTVFGLAKILLLVEFKFGKVCLNIGNSPCMQEAWLILSFARYIVYFVFTEVVVTTLSWFQL